MTATHNGYSSASQQQTEVAMPWVRSHRRRTSLLGRSTWVRSHYRRAPGRVPIIPVVLAVLVILVLIAIF
jgi:hypothetical protein